METMYLNDIDVNTENLKVDIEKTVDTLDKIDADLSKYEILLKELYKEYINTNGSDVEIREDLNSGKDLYLLLLTEYKTSKIQLNKIVYKLEKDPTVVSSFSPSKNKSNVKKISWYRFVEKSNFKKYLDKSNKLKNKEDRLVVEKSKLDSNIKILKEQPSNVELYGHVIQQEQMLNIFSTDIELEKKLMDKYTANIQESIKVKNTKLYKIISVFAFMILIANIF